MSPYLAGGIFAFFITSCAACGYFGYKYEKTACASADNAHDLAQSQNTAAAEKHVVSIVQVQGNISQEASNGYAKNFATISSLYAPGLQQPPAGPVNRVPAVHRAAAGACPPGRPAETKVYKLTPQQCDLEEAKCSALWDWAQKQAALK